MEVTKSWVKTVEDEKFFLDKIVSANFYFHIALEAIPIHVSQIRLWRNPMCDPVLRRSDNTVMSIHDFLCMSSLEKATVREEPHELGTSILSRVADHAATACSSMYCYPTCYSPEKISD
ncbi:hypothetical protein Tco_0164135 [Tanacetum coccineum]